MGEPRMDSSYAQLRDYANYAPTAWSPARIGRQLRVSAESVATIPEQAVVWKTSTITRARIGYTFDRPFWIGLELDPIVTVSLDDSVGVAPSVKGAASFDGRFFEVGLALGTRGVLREVSTNGVPSLDRELRFEGAGFLRVGTRDGIHASVRVGGFRSASSWGYVVKEPSHVVPITLRFQTPIAPGQIAWFVWRMGLLGEADPHGDWMDFSIQARVTPLRLTHTLLLNVTAAIVDDRGALGGGFEWRLPRFGSRRGDGESAARRTRKSAVKRTSPDQEVSP